MIGFSYIVNTSKESWNTTTYSDLASVMLTAIQTEESVADDADTLDECYGITGRVLYPL